MKVALFWICWIRASGRELLSLNIGDVTIDGPRGATLAYAGTHRLKTARSIYLASPSPMHVWMKLHPETTASPLFVGTTTRLDFAASTTKNFTRWLCARHGRRDFQHAAFRTIFPRRLSPHLRNAQGTLGWNEAKLRTVLGWSAIFHAKPLRAPSLAT